ncbi:hypothetical protein Dsin_017879 [Dipteronia sinensis]|uniref:Uncharacterized protein n=1 Tax=Dipteronia sinensis TaxID=43782 RepID=A0AAE0E8C1_9ROSI|nr:hypothetical protein Dsin_017879 [Dipteronia sinensis]
MVQWSRSYLKDFRLANTQPINQKIGSIVPWRSTGLQNQHGCRFIGCSQSSWVWFCYLHQNVWILVLSPEMAEAAAVAYGLKFALDVVKLLNDGSVHFADIGLIYFC